AATPSSTPRARKKQWNTRGVSSTTSARERGAEPGREPGRPTSFTRCRRESPTSSLGVGKTPSAKDRSFSEPDFQRKFRRKCRIQVEQLAPGGECFNDPAQ